MKRLTGFFNMKKWVLGALACAALVLMMPGEAKASKCTFNSNTSGPLQNSTWVYKDGGIDSNDTDTWHELTLNGVNVNTNNDGGIHVPGNTKIVLTGDNTITSDEIGILADGNIMITGNGTLNITTRSSYGIYSIGDVTITGANQLTIDANSNNGISIFDGDLIINGTGTTKITSGSHAINVSNFDYANGTIEMKGNSGWCAEPDSLTLNIQNNPKVSWGSDASQLGKSGETYTSSDNSSLLGGHLLYVKFYDPNPGSNPGTTDPSNPDQTPSDKKSDDKKNESSPFHKFETNSIKEAKASGKIDATGGWKSFDRGTLNELAKLGKDISVTYEFNGHTYCVVVPKGFDPQKLVNEEGYCGFLYLAKVYGAVMIK